ncbi:bifunctional D-glycero-beta-D-manno-heptose-7-phosphate kinase/D-glycero-beta-D-manno-heptose 1-phosphate adenylyltransferase HldE [Thiomicrorhabdus indica]|uniref:bifunctional D-glycero-beta-D-manno-heptose-7-phosphate kinase/D-glycero-beta-D-manno-heptose 1-phosphate adenylyltransferase HldE n=1 Tax=Thiomicrorhabdus indica TaxID=2267253 RepID=UPI002AA72E02|nr:bifunctional D-glycero-beta-D-manno-heptose-7-phosphate kinase/D-glycero-beta-D-manno-heptose 1-phosphate adenylyltransferase HldE [Thiomicrorhabdus indica]
MLDFSNARILVIGDVMLDQYWSGPSERVSPEAPVPVVKIKNDEVRLGGAANVALNLKALGAQVEIAGVIGKDSAGEELTNALNQYGISTHFYLGSTPTIRKLRILSRHQQLLRMDFEETLPPEDSLIFTTQTLPLLKNFDLVLISDYGKGCLNEVQRLIQKSNELQIKTFIDPKGDCYEKYRGATLIKPNQSEFCQITGSFNDENDFDIKAAHLIEKLKIEHLLVTRSEHGMALFGKTNTPYKIATRAQDVYDVTGAGDTVIATLAAAFANGKNLQESVNLANMAAGIVVAKVGTATASIAELNDQFSQSQRHQGYVSPSKEQLKELVEQAQQQGQKVVFTNGCFDILHSGHVRYLDEAAKQGDKLIIAVNTDESVQTLKGPSRPIIPLENRMELLASLSFVDWVVPFSEETPRDLICYLQPDVLVKGGDYQPHEIAGCDCVWENGGEVKILSFWDGFSTSNIVERIQTSLNDHRSNQNNANGGAKGDAK